MKHPMPESYQKYLDLTRQGPPQCCHSCIEYDLKSGVCTLHKMEVPVEFTQQIGACPTWTNCPF